MCVHSHKKRRQSSQTVMHTDTPILNCCKSLDCIQLKEFSDISTMYPAFNSVLYARAAHKGVESKHRILEIVYPQLYKNLITYKDETFGFTLSLLSLGKFSKYHFENENATLEIISTHLFKRKQINAFSNAVS